MTSDMDLDDGSDHIFILRELFGIYFPIKFLVLYGGIMSLIFALYLVLTPYFYFRFKRRRDIEAEERERAKWRHRPVITMSAQSVNGLKATVMAQSKAMRKLSKWKRRKLESFGVA